MRAGNDFGLLGIKKTQNLFGVRICFKKYSCNLINVLSCGKVVGSATLISKRNDAIPFKHGSPCIKYQVIFLLFAGSLHWLLSCDIPTVLCPITPVPLKSPNDGIFYHKIFWPFVIHLLCCLPDPAAFQITEGCCIKLELVYNDICHNQCCGSGSVILWFQIQIRILTIYHDWNEFPKKSSTFCNI